MVKRRIKPIAKYIGTVKTTAPPHKVQSQLKILIPVGTAIIMVAVLK
jgi:hypothetical protein